MSQTICTRNISLTSKLGHRLIKFRYGPQRDNQPAATQHASGASHGGTRASPPATQGAIWDFQIPARWKRAPLSEEECAVINNGGPL